MEFWPHNMRAILVTMENDLVLCGGYFYRCTINPEHVKEIPVNPVPINPKDIRVKFVEDTSDVSAWSVYTTKKQ
jgi:hypothetical protein